MPSAGAAALAWALLWLLAPPPALPEPLDPKKNVEQKDAVFDRTYSDWVASDTLNIYAFNHTVLRNRVSRGTAGWAPTADGPGGGGLVFSFMGRVPLFGGEFPLFTERISHFRGEFPFLEVYFRFGFFFGGGGDVSRFGVYFPFLGMFLI